MVPGHLDHVIERTLKRAVLIFFSLEFIKVVSGEFFLWEFIPFFSHFFSFTNLTGRILNIFHEKNLISLIDSETYEFDVVNLRSLQSFMQLHSRSYAYVSYHY